METVDEEITAGALKFMTGEQGRQAVLRLVELDPHAYLYAPQAGIGLARPASASRRTAWSSTTAWWAAPRQAQRIGHRGLAPLSVEYMNGVLSSMPMR